MNSYPSTVVNAEPGPYSYPSMVVSAMPTAVKARMPAFCASGFTPLAVDDNADVRCDAIFIETAGDLVFIPRGGGSPVALTLDPMLAPIKASRILTGTTATGYLVI